MAAGNASASLISSSLNLQDMRFTELAEGDLADFYHDCRKNLGNTVADWIEIADKYHDVQLTEQEARSMRQECRAAEDKLDRYHPILRNDGPWF